jgi:DNA-binding CsgD family transcriptional regulator
MTTKKQSSKVMASKIRQAQIVKLKLAGYNDILIGENLKVSPYRVRKEFKMALDKMNDDSDNALKTYRNTVFQRYESMFRKLYPKIMQEQIDYDALNACLKIMEGQRRMVGVDTPNNQINIDARQQTHIEVTDNLDYRKEMKKRVENYIESIKSGKDTETANIIDQN